MNEKQPSADEIVKLLAESYMRMSEHASDIAYARRTMYEAYVSEGFTPQESLELCKDTLILMLTSTCHFDIMKHIERRFNEIFSLSASTL